METDSLRLRRSERKAERENDTTAAEGTGKSPSLAFLPPAARRRQIWIVYFVGFIDLLSISMMIPLSPRLYRMLGASPALAGLIGSVYGVIQVFSSPIVGKLSDVYGRKKLIFLSYLIPAVGYLMLTMAASYQSFPLLLLSRLPTGIFKHGLSVSKAYLSDITEVNDRQGVLGLFNACSSLGFIFGPLISGYLADLDESLQLSILCGTVVFSVNIVLVVLLVRSIPAANKSTRSTSGSDGDDVLQMMSLRSFLASVNIFRGVKWWKMTDLIALKFFATLSVLMFRSNLTIFIQDHFDADYKTLGKIMSFNGIVSAVAAATGGYVSRLYTSQRRQLIHLLLLMSLSLLGATCAPNIFVLVVMIVPLAISTANLRICVLNLFLSRVSEEEKGEVIGLNYSITSVSRMLSPSFVGVAQEWSSVLSGYVSAGLACATAVTMVTRPLNSGRSKSVS